MRVRTSLRSLARTIALVATLVLLAACGGGASQGTDGTTADGVSSPGAQSGQTGDTVPPLPDGFPDGPITLIVVDEAGSDDGIYARHLQSALEDVSPVQINVSDRPDLGSAYGTFEALQAVSSEAGGEEGYVVVVADVAGTVLDLVQTPVAQELDVGLEDANWVIGNELVPWVIVSRTDAPWGDSFEEMISYCQENPGDITYVSRGPGAVVNTAFLQYTGAADCEVTEVVGGSAQEIAIALGAGEGDVAISVVGVTLPLIEDGRLVPLACTGNTTPCPGDWESDIPSAASIVGIDEDPWGSTRALVVPQEVPAQHRQWLYDLFRLANDDEGYRESRAQLPGLELIDLDHDEVDQLARDVIDFGYPILEEQDQIDPSVTSPPE